MTVDAMGEKAEDENLEEEVAGGEVDEAEEEEDGGTEVEGEHGIPRHEPPRLAEQLCAYLLGHVRRASIFLS